MPGSITLKEGFRKLKNLPFDERFKHAIEVRHVSWFDDDFYDFMRANNFCLVWSQRDKVATPPVVTNDFLYVRLIGDRSINEKDFGRIQKDRINEMQQWSDELRKHDSLKVGIVAANNHYAGLGLAPQIHSEDWLACQKHIILRIPRRRPCSIFRS